MNCSRLGDLSMNQPQQLIEHIADNLRGQTCFLVGFSGGLDSSVLLHALVQLRASLLPSLTLRAIHIHHGLNPLAENWVEHCQAQCQGWNVPFEVVRVQLDTRHSGIEAAARTARYQAFSSHLAVGETLLTAQHLDDQSETFLLALKRGSGPAGLSSMAAVMPFADSQILRPLLAISRKQLERYAEDCQLEWIEDDSNQDDRFDRNFLRLKVLPVLSERWPHFSRSVARSAELCAEQEQLLDELLSESLAQLRQPDGSLAINGLALMSEAKRGALLRRWLAEKGVAMPAREQLQRIWNEVALARADAEPVLELAPHQVRRFRQHLYVLPRLEAITTPVLPWSVPSRLALPAGLGSLELTDDKGQKIRVPAENEPVSVRFGLQGNVRIVGRQHSRRAKKLWQELGIPPWERERIPLLYFGEQLIAAVGVFITPEGVAEEDGACWCVQWRQLNNIINNE
ncbi:tRNA(Ile)-lysidine synthetase [Yersinia nurmii]|uniref:tRNA(Ile)-lysidine synthase n=1 Tax=Yersinia nurmii TaxID=685706 RepID=A0ABM9SKE7_9GAMM|nr:tRNA(Ile)-lysidine synthetase [Yersinia nurmii]